MAKTLFQKIADHDIPAQLVYEDERLVAFRDIKPGAPVHILVVPRKAIPRIAEATEDDKEVLGHLLVTAAKIAANEGLSQTGFRLVLNNGRDAGESVPHLHCHIMGGRAMGWPPG